MRYDERFLDEIKGRLRLSDVIGKTVKLRRQGREFVGLSPFTKERTPSFFVNDDKGFFHDFSSGKHGDLISFLQETERLSFIEAVERLAAEAGVPLPAPDPHAAAEDKARQGLADWLELAAAWFEAELRRPGGRATRDYLIARGLPESEWARFRVGYSPPGRVALKDYLVAKGALPDDLVRAGLLVAPEDGGSPFDRFRDRIMFPIADTRGRVISFGGRAMDPRQPAKYLNGPDSPLFDKGRVLFGQHEARRLLQAGPADGAVVVVEGYMDVIACQRSDVAAVAAMGTSLTEAQMEMLWRLHPEPTLCFDGDRAGRQAASRAIDRALPMLSPQRNFKIAILEDGHDPDDLFRNQGPAALREALRATKPLARMLLEREVEAQEILLPEHLVSLHGRLRGLAGTIANPEMRTSYQQQLREAVDVWWREKSSRKEAGRRQGRTYARSRQGGWTPPLESANPQTRAAAKRLASAINPPAAALARWAIHDPGVLDDHLEGLEANGFGDPALNDLARQIIRLRLEADRLDSEVLQRHLAGNGFSTLLIDIDRAATLAGAPFMKPDVTLAAARSQWSRAFEALSRLAALDVALAAAKLDFSAGGGASALMGLKAERDRLRRAVETGAIWNEDPSA